MKSQDYISTDLLSCDLLKKVYKVKISIALAYNGAPESRKKLVLLFCKSMHMHKLKVS